MSMFYRHRLDRCLRLFVAVILCVASVLCLTVATQHSHANPMASTLAKQPKDEDVQKTKDSFGRDTPKGTVQGFMRAIANDNHELAANYLDDDYLKQSKLDPVAVVAQLKSALDVGGILHAEIQLSGVNEGDLSDNLPSQIDKVGKIQLMNEQIDLLLVRHEKDDGSAYWQVSSQTLSQLPAVGKQSATLAQKLKFDKLTNRVIFGIDVSEFSALLLLVAIAYVMVYVLVYVVIWLLNRVFLLINHTPTVMTTQVVMPLALIVLSLLLPMIMLKAGVPVTLRSLFGRAKDIVAWVATAWLVVRLLDLVFDRAESISLKRNRPEQVSILNLLRKVAKVFMLIIAIIIVFGSLGFDLTAGIAALGIGGIALAFGAQKTIENLIGSVMVVADRPIHVGDYCRFGDMEGTVIDIGIRSSRIRTLNRTIVTVPNGDFSAMKIENYTARDMFHFLHCLYLKRTANPDEIARLIDETQQFLGTHHMVNEEWTQVRIKELRQDCFVIEIRCYIIADDVRVFYARQSQVAIDVLNFIKQFDVEHALPSQEIQMHQSKSEPFVP